MAHVHQARLLETSLYRHNNHLNANLRHIRLDKLRRFQRAGIPRLRAGGHPQLEGQVFQPQGFQAGAGLLRIIFGNFSVIIVGPRGPRQHGRRRLRGAIVDGLHQALVVNRQRQGMAHLRIIQRRLSGVEGQPGDVHSRAQRQAQARVVTQDRQLAGGWPGQHVAFSGQQFRQAAGAAGAKVDHHLGHQRFAAPVAGVALQANILSGAVIG